MDLDNHENEKSCDLKKYLFPNQTRRETVRDQDHLKNSLYRLANFKGIK